MKRRRVYWKRIVVFDPKYSSVLSIRNHFTLQNKIFSLQLINDVVNLKLIVILKVQLSASLFDSVCSAVIMILRCDLNIWRIRHLFDKFSINMITVGKVWFSH